MTLAAAQLDDHFLAEVSQCESVAEVALLRLLEKYRAFDLPIENQVDVATALGRFRLDFVATTPSGKVAIECDGEEWHGSPKQHAHDERRDGVIVASGDILLVCHIPAAGVLYHPEATAFWLGSQKLGLVNERAMAGLSEYISGSYGAEAVGEIARRDHAMLYKFCAPWGPTRLVGPFWVGRKPS